MRLLRSPWAYLGWLTLFLFEIWHDLHPHVSMVAYPWPTFHAVTVLFGEIFCICLMFSLAGLTSDALERAALGLLAIAFALSTVVDLYKLSHFHTPPPSFRLVFLTLNAFLALLTAIRFIQVLREPPTPGILSRTPTHSE
jgi:hypothetical protein